MPTYKNGNYFVTMYADGTKVRQTNDDEFIPQFAENQDVKITDKCNEGCPFCYEGCTSHGSHADLFKYNFINTLHPYTEFALNGNDIDHPQLEDFLHFLHTKRIYTNITVNQNQFIRNFDKLKKWQSEKLIYGIGVSLIKATPELISRLAELKNTVLHTIVGILSKDDIDSLKNNNLKLLILGYKDLQRGVTFKSSHSEQIIHNTKYLYDNLDEMTHQFNVVSFDNLALEQLDVKRIVSDEDWEQFYMGDDGGYTFYIDMVKGEFAKNSISQERFPIGDKTIDEMFKFIQEHYK